MNSNEHNNSIIERSVDEFKNLLDELRPFKSKLKIGDLSVFESVDNIIKNATNLSGKINAYKTIGESNFEKITILFSFIRDEILDKNIRANIDFKHQCELDVDKYRNLVNEIKPFKSKLTEDELSYFKSRVFDIDDDFFKSKIELYKFYGKSNMDWHINNLTKLKEKFIK